MDCMTCVCHYLWLICFMYHYYLNRDNKVDHSYWNLCELIICGSKRGWRDMDWRCSSSPPILLDRHLCCLRDKVIKERVVCPVYHISCDNCDNSWSATIGSATKSTCFFIIMQLHFNLFSTLHWWPFRLQCTLETWSYGSADHVWAHCDLLPLDLLPILLTDYNAVIF